MARLTHVYSKGSSHHPRVLQDVAFERVEVRVGICVRKEARLRLGDEAIDAGDMARQRGDEQRCRSVQQQSAREEYLDRRIAESFATAEGWGAGSGPSTSDARNSGPYSRKITATMTRKVRMPVGVIK